MQRQLVSACTLMIAVAFAGCAGLGGSSHVDVKAVDDQFQPNTLNLKQNQAVEWHNDGARAHTVTIHKAGETGTKKDTEIQSSAATTYTFQETGTFHVYCKYHCPGCLTGSYGSGMVMTVNVA